MSDDGRSDVFLRSVCQSGSEWVKLILHIAMHDRTLLCVKLTRWVIGVGHTLDYHAIIIIVSA